MAEAVADGLTSHEIADRFGLSHQTVKAHIDRSFVKLGFHNRVQLAVWWVKQGHLDCDYCDLDIPTTDGYHLVPDPEEAEGTARIRCPRAVH